jgi:hypothetical protein
MCQHANNGVDILSRLRSLLVGLDAEMATVDDRYFVSMHYASMMMQPESEGDEFRKLYEGAWASRPSQLCPDILVFTD